ncbi:aspartyl-phosphate phosphatase Spo0E family protein [Brevibacillus laterosporus]|uniref:aspartyl-phosphate phosphatase Spo0E family protein n=1 Tax=Brevibacillus laterosporus TaxID=1465 RepID=UPI00195958BD|nr:aspartyl-phosphate phosphatase Spo0E family protein [Brevibacillus laterosporus]MBM7111686.1 Spo0E like sporulation regulatory protein [Brevibacillus laterosporus]
MKKDIPLTYRKGMSNLQKKSFAITLSQNDCDLQRKTEALREKLVQLFFQEGSFTSPAVLEISKQLDDCIVATQKVLLRLTK